MGLTGKQRRYLRGLGHALEPVVQIGKGGIDDGVIAAVGAALERHELIKLRVGNAAPETEGPVAAALASATGAEIAQVLGHSILLYRARAERPTIRLPQAGEPADDPGEGEVDPDADQPA